MNSLSQLSLEKLQKRQKFLKGIITGFTIVWLFAIGIALYLFTSHRSLTLMLPLLPFPITMAPIVIYMQQLNKEIKLKEIL